MNKLVFGMIHLSTLLIMLATIAMAQATRLEGQIVCCAECWAKADRTKATFGTAEDLLTAKSCVAGGDPTLIAVREGETFKLYQLEQGKFRLPGKNWLEFIGKQVTVTGLVKKKKNINLIHVNSLEVLAQSIAEQQAANVIGKEIELVLKDPFGIEQRLSALKGRIVVLNFWATYCTPCRKEMPALAAIQNEYAALGLQVVGASADEAEDRERVLEFAKETKVNFPIWIGTATSDMIRFGIGSALPGTVIIGRDGRIAKVISGVVNQADLKKQVDVMLALATEVVVKERDRVASRNASEVSSVPS